MLRMLTCVRRHAPTSYGEADTENRIAAAGAFSLCCLCPVSCCWQVIRSSQPLPPLLPTAWPVVRTTVQRDLRSYRTREAARAPIRNGDIALP